MKYGEHKMLQCGSYTKTGFKRVNDFFENHVLYRLQITLVLQPSMHLGMNVFECKENILDTGCSNTARRSRTY